MGDVNPDKTSAQEATIDEKESTCSLDTGLLVLRLGIGIIFVLHGWPKLTGGPETWKEIGGAMGVVGITFSPVFWGFLAALAEAIGGFLLAIGLFVRPAAFFLLATMIVATFFLLDAGVEYSTWSHPLKAAIVFLGLLIMGGGRFSLGAAIPAISGKIYQ